jgi:hypothetical protein
MYHMRIHISVGSLLFFAGPLAINPEKWQLGLFNNHFIKKSLSRDKISLTKKFSSMSTEDATGTNLPSLVIVIFC